MTVLRSAAWDGPPPAAGDQVVIVYRVRAVASGPGAGQYRLDVDADTVVDPDARTIWWSDAATP